MARPPKNAQGPSATDRMEAAFWKCLQDMPFETITVRDIVEKADVNRNSYYYHYESMMDLARAGMHNSVVLEFARALLESKPSTTRFTEGPEGEKDATEKLHRLRLLAGPNGSFQLLSIVKETIVGEWLNMYAITEDELTPEARTAIEYVFGGISSLWACDRFESIVDMLSEITKSKLITHDIGVLRKELKLSAEQTREKVEQPAQPEEEPEDIQMQISLF